MNLRFTGETYQRWRACGRKRRYQDEDAALAAKDYRHKHGSVLLTHYSCKLCGGYHLTKVKLT